jgi:protein-disulfide isomerase
VLAGAALIVAIAIAVSRSAQPGATPAAASGAPAGASASRALFAGVPQDGITLGDPKAPVRVIEFADLQCPFCAAAARNVLPGLVKDYVRPGKARIEFRALTFIGPDSVRAARVAEAAGRQNRLWNVVDLVYASQGRENTGYATDAFLRRLVRAVPSLDAGRVFAQRGSAAVTAQLKAAQDLAASRGVTSTPTFLVERGTSLEVVDAAGVPAAIKAALAR